MKNFIFYIGCCLSFTTCATSNTANSKAETSDTTTARVANVTPSSNADTARNRQDLSGSWQLKEMPGSNSDWSKVPILILDVSAGTFSGNTGCNSMNGRFVVQGKGKVITFDNEIITTKMACVGNYNEKTFLDNLLRVNNYSINDTALHLRQLDTVKMIFKRQPI